MPAVGSLISLISRTGIRYEGSMYTVDLNDSTIALSHGERETRARAQLMEKDQEKSARARAKRQKANERPPDRQKQATDGRQDFVGRARRLPDLFTRTSINGALH